MLMTPDQQQNLLLLHDEPARHILPRLAQCPRSWEHLMQTSRAVCSAELQHLMSFEVPLCVMSEPRLPWQRCAGMSSRMETNAASYREITPREGQAK